MANSFCINAIQATAVQTNWDDLRIFLAVARNSSLSGAGKRLRLDPATVGRRIQKLETALQTVLFTKSPQGYALTETGQALLARAEQAETAMRAAVAVLPEQSDRLSGQIRIGAPDGAANYLMPQVCAAILKENPDLEIQIVALPRVFNLSRREADMAIGVSAPTAGRLIVQKITDYKLHLAAVRWYLRQNAPMASKVAAGLRRPPHPLVGGEGLHRKTSAMRAFADSEPTDGHRPLCVDANYVKFPCRRRTRPALGPGGSSHSFRTSRHPRTAPAAQER